MTKSRHSATRLRLSRLVRCLVALCCLKVSLLGLAVLDVPLPSWLGNMPGALPGSGQQQDRDGNGAMPDDAETARRLDAALRARGLTAGPAAEGQPGESGPVAVGEMTRGASGAGAGSPAVADVADAGLAAAADVAASAASQAMPQGSAAAELAAAARPRPREQQALPAPLIAPLAERGGAPDTAGTSAISGTSGTSGTSGIAGTPDTSEASGTPGAGNALTPALPVPPPLGSPLAAAGIPAPQTEPGTATPASGGEASLWNMLGLTSLPIPGLGSAQAAHAAALDMPVPPVPPPASPFAPAEQTAPLRSPSGMSGGSRDMPGAPAIPATIPRGQDAGGAPLPARGEGAPLLPALPQGTPAPTVAAPAPRVTPQPPADDPNAKAQELARQQQDILMLRQQMDQRLKDLQNAEDKMKDMIREAKELEDKKVRNLILMYGNMKPRMAAQALENMDERVAVRILSGMPPKQSGEILTYTKPAKTAKFTEMITRMRMPE